MSDRLQVRFHPSLPIHAQRLIAALDVDVRYDENAPRRCDNAGCVEHRQHESVERMARAARQRARDAVCPQHREKWITVRGVRTCRACEREAEPPTTGDQ